VAIAMMVIRAEEFFADPELAGAITGIDVNLTYRSKEVLEVISSGHKINTDKYSKYTTDIAEMYVRIYPWHPMTPTLHKILIHGAIVIQNALLPIGQLSEQAAEAYLLTYLLTYLLHGAESYLRN
jgi:hypothetical protein